MKSSQAVRGKALKPKSSKPANTLEQVTSILSSEGTTVAVVSLVVTVFICYSNSLANDFVFDDFYLVVENDALRNFTLSKLLNSYRPIRDASYALDFALWGQKAYGFHLTNILLHSANVLAVFALVRRLSKDLILATLTALIFAVHPIQTDAVTYISGRRDLLFSFFYLLALHAYLSYYRTKWSARAAVYFVLFVGAWSLSLLSKEMAASLPLLIFLWHYCEAWEPEQNWWSQAWRAVRSAFQKEKWLWPLLGVGGLAFTGYWVLVKGGSTRARWGLEYWGGSIYLNLLTVIRVHAWYLKQLVFPTPIAQYLGAFEVSRSILDWTFIFSFLVVGGVVAAGLLLLNRHRVIAFAILSYFVLLLPVSQIIPHHELLADHYLYLPIISLGLFVALLVRKISDVSRATAKTLYLAVSLAIVILAVMTIFQNRTWKNERTLWTANYRAVPNSPRAALNLGSTYQNSEPDKAEFFFKKALGLNPPPEIRKTLYDRLPVVLIQQRKFDEAEFFVEDVLSKSPNDFFGNLWASQINLGKRDCIKARNSLAKALSMAKAETEMALADQTKTQLERECTAQ